LLTEFGADLGPRDQRQRRAFVKDSYLKLGIALAVSLILMFVLTMSMVRTIDHFYLNLSNFYMALIMVAPMGIVM
jgi:hypothetical protein